MRRGKTRMFDGELKEAAWSENPVSLSQDPIRFWNVHEAHEGYRKIKRRISKREGHRARHRVIDVSGRSFLLLPRVVDKHFGYVDGCHTRPALGDEPGVVPLPASDIQARETTNIRKKRKERRRIQVIPVNVIAASCQLRPDLGVLIPILAGFFVVHRATVSIRFMPVLPRPRLRGGVASPPVGPRDRPCDPRSTGTL